MVTTVPTLVINCATNSDHRVHHTQLLEPKRVIIKTMKLVRAKVDPIIPNDCPAILNLIWVSISVRSVMPRYSFFPSVSELVLFECHEVNFSSELLHRSFLAWGKEKEEETNNIGLTRLMTAPTKVVLNGNK